ncbi:MAG: hypothetical protein ISS17_09405 [Bacteroidales bacterium]|nr:hypothetical protein [Bacteroidales bacterium]
MAFSIRKILKRFLKWMLWFLGMLLVAELVIYFMAPIYIFEEPKPFSGEQWFNPYHNIDSGNWHRANFHFHTKRWAGITSGKGTEEECYEQYRKLGYSVAALSHYQHITEFQKDSPFYIPVYEHGFGVRKKHQLLIGAKKVLWLDYFLIQNVNHKQHIINLLRPASEIVTIAHPDWANGYSPEDMRYLSNYDLIEVLNNNWNSFEQWDAALSAGRPVYIQGNDDGHDIYDPYVVGRRCTFINSPTRNVDDLIRNLKSGNAFGADIYMREHESFDEKEARAKMIPKITEVSTRNDTLWVKTDTVALKFTFIGQDGKARKVQYLTDTGWYKLQSEDTYIRTEIVFFSQYRHPGTIFYLNPVFRYNGDPPSNRLTATINWERTWIFRIMTLGSLAVGLWLIFRYRCRKTGFNKRGA